MNAKDTGLLPIFIAHFIFFWGLRILGGMLHTFIGGTANAEEGSKTFSLLFRA